MAVPCAGCIVVPDGRFKATVYLCDDHDGYSVVIPARPNVDEVVTTIGYTPEEQVAYCDNYCLPEEHHEACALRAEVEEVTPDA